MKLNKKNRMADCQYCFEEYHQKKSNQKFCSTSCRVGSHNLNKQKTSSSLTGVATPEVSSTQKKSTAEHILDITKVAAVVLGENAVKSAKGVNNSDLSKKLEAMSINQDLLRQIIRNQGVLDAKLKALLDINKPRYTM
jgi:hypothetical protein